MKVKIMTIDERIAKLDEKKKQIEAQRRQLMARQSKEQRAARTHRLVEIGATCEAVLGKSIEKEDLPKLRAFLEQQEQRGHYFSKAFNSLPAENSSKGFN